MSRVDRSSKKITFSPTHGFYTTLKGRVDNYFDEKGISKTGDWRLFLKTIVILLLLITSYVILVFLASSALTAIIAAVVLSQSLALVGTNIMHDGNHGSYSSSKRVNWLMGFTLDLIGASQFFWRQKHNILHHTYTNIEELDDDLNTSGLLRLSPDQKWRRWHRYQHWYAFPVYSLLTLTWVFFADFEKFFTGKIGGYRLNRPGVGQSFLFFATKAFYFGIAIGIPLIFHSFFHVIVFLLGIHLFLGLTLAITFQLAHTVEGASFPHPEPVSRKVKNEWAIHEIQTTANFARGSRLAAWYLGGLNFQIEHHLFPRISHVHYPAISEIVEQTCTEFNIRYLSFPSVFSAIKAHLKHLKAMGSAAEPVPV